MGATFNIKRMSQKEQDAQTQKDSSQTQKTGGAVFNIRPAGAPTTAAKSAPVQKTEIGAKTAGAGANAALVVTARKMQQEQAFDRSRGRGASQAGSMGARLYGDETFRDAQTFVQRREVKTQLDQARETYETARRRVGDFAQGSIGRDQRDRAKADMSAARSELERLEKKYVELGGEPSGFLNRALYTVKGGAKQSLGSNADAMGFAYQIGQTSRDDLNNSVVSTAKRAYEDDLWELNDMIRSGKAEEVIERQRQQVEASKKQYEALAGIGDAQRQAGEAARELAARIAAPGAGDVETAKRGLGMFGQMVVDAGASVTQSAIDRRIGRVLGVAPTKAQQVEIQRLLKSGVLSKTDVVGVQLGQMLPFASRAFGGKTMQARAEGADLNQQMLYGAAGTTIEVASEFLSDIAAPFAKVFGNGVLDGAVDRAIASATARLAKTEVGQQALGRVLTYAAGGIGEGLEELIADWMEWQLPRIYGGEVDSAAEMLAQSLYDFSVGTLSGLADPRTLMTPYDGVSGNRVDETGTPPSISSAVAKARAGERVSNAEAEAILGDPGALAALEEMSGGSLTEGKTRSQQRNAVRDALAEIAAAEKRTSAPAANEQRKVIPEAARAAFGTEGQKVADMVVENTMLRGKSLAEAYGAFSQAYHQGVTNAEKTAVDGLTEDGLAFAYNAGKADAAASLKQEKRAARFASVAGKDSGLVLDDYVQDLLSNTEMEQTEYDTLNDTAKALGVRVRFVDELEHGANAAIDGAEVRIQKDNPNPLRFLLGHELTHRMQELAPAEYRVFRDLVMDALGSESVSQHRSDYQAAGVTLSYEAAMDELTADFAGELVLNGDVLEQFIENNRENRTLLERVRDAIRALIEKLTGKERDQAMTAEQALTRALEAASKQAEKNAKRTKNTAQTDGGGRYSLNPEFSKQFEEWLQSGTAKERSLQSRGYFNIGTTSTALKSIGVRDGNIYWRKQKIAYIMEDHSEIDAETVKSVPNILENPIVVMKSATRDDSIVLFGDVKAANGENVMAALELTPRSAGGMEAEFSLLASAYGRSDENVKRLVEKSEILYLDSNKKRTDTWLKSIRVQFPSDQPVYGSMGSIRYENGTVNIQGQKIFAVDTENTAQTDGGTRYSLNPAFSAELDAWDGRSKHTFRIGTTSVALQSIGVQDKGIVWHGGKIAEIMRKHPGMTKDVIKQVPNVIENPILVLKSRQSESRIVIFGELQDVNGSPVTAVIELQPTTKGGELLDMSVIASAYGKDTNPADFVRKSELLYIDPDKNRTQSWMQGVGLQLPSDTTALGSIDRITYQDGNVKIEGVPFEQYMQDGDGKSKTRFSLSVDSTGRQLTAEQANGGTRYSIGYDRENRPFVTVESDILAGVHKSEWVWTVKENLRKKFPNGVTVGNNEIQIDTQSRREMTWSKYTQWLYNEHPNIYTDKLRATDSADEILLASQGYVNEGLKHPRKDNIKDFARGTVLLRIGGRDYTAEVIVGTKTDGTMLLYDLLNLKGTKINEKSQTTVKAAYPSPSTSRKPVADSSHTDSIRNSGEDVNGKFSMHGAREFAEQVMELQRNRGDKTDTQVRTEIVRLMETFQQKLAEDERQGLTDRTAVRKTGRALIKEFGADLKPGDITGDLQTLYDYMAGGENGDGGISYGQTRERAVEIARKLVGSATVVDDTLYREFSDLRMYLRDTKIVVPEEVTKEIGDFNDYRKSTMGKLVLGTKGHANLDMVYSELCETYPAWFDGEAIAAADQLDQIVNAAEAIYQRTEYNPFDGGNMEQAVQVAASEIMETFYDLPQAKSRQSGHRSERERAELRREVSEQLNRQREYNDRQMEKVRQKHQETVTQLETRNLRQRIARHANRMGQMLLKPTDKKHVPENLRGAAATLVEAINLESAYVWSFDEETGKAKLVLEENAPEGAKTKRTEAFLELRAQYAKLLQELQDGEGTFTGVIDPELAEYIDGAIELRGKRLSEMDRGELDTIWKALRAVENSITTADKVLSQAKYERVEDWAMALDQDTGTRKNKVSSLKAHPSLDLETPYTFFSHFGESGTAIYKMLRGAQDRQQMMVEEIAKAVEEIVTPEQVKALREETHEFVTERGQTLTLTTEQVMELYELTKRKQAHDHLMEGGIVQPEVGKDIRRGTEPIKLSAEDLKRLSGLLTEEQAELADKMQRLCVTVLARWGNDASLQAYGYKKFNDRNYWPIRSAREGLYQTIEKGGNQPRQIKNIGMGKATTPHANTPLDITGLFTTFARHAADMSDYAAWLCPMEDCTRLFNYKFRDEEGAATGESIKGLLEQKAGEQAQAYWSNLMEDIQNGIAAKSDSMSWGTIGRLVGSFKGAAVGGNMRVVIQQPTAFFRAAAVLNPADLKSGVLGGVAKVQGEDGKTLSGWEKALKYSPIAVRKDRGGFDISNPRMMTEILYDDRTKLQKWNDFFSWGAGKADAVTWGGLWNACEHAVQREQKALEVGSKAFFEAVNEKFSDVIDQTQVVDGVLQRSNIMRSSNAVVQQATSFMGEPIMSLNLMMRAWDAWRYEQNPAARGKALKTMGRAASALVVTNLVNAVAQSLVDAVRADDPDKDYLERFMAALTGLDGDEESVWDKFWSVAFDGNAGQNNNVLTQIPFVKDVVSLIEGYDVARTEMEVISDLVTAAQNVIQNMDGDGKRTRKYALNTLVRSAAKLFGLPVQNLERDAWGFLRTFAVGMDNIPLQYEMEKAVYNLSYAGNKGRFLDVMYRALEQEDYDAYDHIRNDLMNSGVADGKTIDNGMRSRLEARRGVNPAYALPERAAGLIGWRSALWTGEQEERFDESNLDAAQYTAFSEERAELYRGYTSRLESNVHFAGMDDETREKVYAAAEKLAKAKALEDNANGQFEMDTAWMQWATGGGASGVDETEAILFKVAYDMASGQDENGKTVAGLKKERTLETAENWMPWLADQELEYLMGNFWK